MDEQGGVKDCNQVRCGKGELYLAKSAPVVRVWDRSCMGSGMSTVLPANERVPSEDRWVGSDEANLTAQSPRRKILDGGGSED